MVWTSSDRLDSSSLAHMVQLVPQDLQKRLNSHLRYKITFFMCLVEEIERICTQTKQAMETIQMYSKF